MKDRIKNHVDAWRDRYRGSYKLANIIAGCAAAIVLSGLLASRAVDIVPHRFTTARIIFCAATAYGLAFAVMLWLPARALTESRALDEVEKSKTVPVLP
jgi:putative Ca2+/H+ antiporter (TMEM165/GDT1 family)